MSAFDVALERCRKVGASRATDDELLAAFCKDNLPHIVGAVSPKLVWEGARKRGMSTKELAAMAATDVIGVSDLQWI